MNLTKPVVVNDYIDMTTYLPKNEYLYGTDFNKAISEINKVRETTNKLPQNWWNNNNGTTFTVPYEKAYLIERCVVRSNIENIKDGYIYPFSTNREHILIPEKFKLNKENGIFIGLFLAEGNADFDSGYIQITNNNKNIREFTKNWFTKHNIKCSESEKINKIGGTSSEIRGYSRLLAKFLTKLVGHGARNKFIPNEAINAPEEFIIGLLNGYISGDGSISKNSIDVGSASPKLIQGINILLSRLGIFTKVSVSKIEKNNLGTENIADVNRISIRCQWANKFAKLVELIDENKQDKLQSFKITKDHCNFTEQNDVVLDNITSIEILNVKDYPEYAKVYDLTVPSTLNFGLANGLHVVDTAESGYVQRKLVKTMEDLVIKYDSTLRSFNNAVIQFIYGDSGADTRYQYEYTIKLIEQNNQDLENIHKFTSSELKDLDFSDKDNNKLFNYVLELRNLMRELTIKSKLDYITLTSSYLIPININPIINTVKIDEELRKSKEKLEPNYVIEGFEKLLSNKFTSFMCFNKEVDEKKSFKVRDELINKTSLRCVLYDALSPKKAIIDHKLNKKQFDEIIRIISENYNKNIAQPGEHVGVLSAQAMGEPVSQMSEVYETLVHVYNSELKSIEKIQIGKFIDRLMKENKDKVMELENHKNSTVLDLPKDKYKIVNVSGKEKTNWQTIDQISKHPANGKLMTVVTRSGKTNKSTLSHSYLKRSTNSIIPVKGSELKVGDRIPVTRKLKLVNTNDKLDDIELTNHFGWLCGAYLADGTASGNILRISKVNKKYSNNIISYAKKNLLEYKIRKYEGEYGHSMDTVIIDKKITSFMLKHFSTGSYDKQVSGDIFNTNQEFISGLISGYFDGDGNVSPARHIIRASSRSLQLLEDMSLLLNYIGIFATIHTEKEKGPNKKPFYTLHIQHKYAKLFKEEIGFVVEEKQKLLDEIIEYAERDNNYSLGENVDMIPELGETIAKVADYLEMPARSRLYRRYIKKKAIGRETLGKYIERFNEALLEVEKQQKLKPLEMADLNVKLGELKQAYNSDIVWDEIVSIEYEDGGDQYVYDFTVPGNDSFMVNSGVLVHNTLKAFHKAGIGAISDTLQGVPRIKELFSLSKKIKTPQMIVYLTDEYYKNKEMAHKIASYIRFTTLGQIRKKVEVFYDPNPHAKDGFMEKDNVYNIYYTHNPSKTSCQTDINNLPWLIRIELDRERMLEKEVTLLEIKSKFCNQWEKRYSDIKNIKKEEKYILDKIIQCALLSNTDNDEKPVIHLRFDMTDFEFTTINEFIDLMIDRFKLKGISGINERTGAIEERVLKFDKESGNIIKDNQFVIYTQGVNLMDVRYLTGVDVYKTICNDVVQMYDTFGIEAARATIVREISLAFKRHGADVNYNHLSVIVDLMTSSGMLMSVDRHGMNKSDNEPLARVSFEKMVEQLITAAVFNEVDHMKSVSSRIMAGLVVKGGTGMCDVILDTEMLEKSEYVVDAISDYDTSYKEISKNSVIQDMINKEESAGEIFMPM